MTLSLNQRVSLSALIIVLVFISITATALNQAFINSSEQALKQTLKSYTLTLIGSTDVYYQNNQPQLTTTSADLIKLFNLPDSGLYAQIIDAKGNILWQSQSILNVQVPKGEFLAAGREAFKQKNDQNKQFLQHSFGVEWLIDNRALPLSFTVTQDLNDFHNKLNTYRNTLWFWLVLLAIVLVITQLLVLRWGLLPMQRISKEIKRIEAGKQQLITGEYPKEIIVISESINQLLKHEQQQKKRYKHALGDLAHSLKTPLAVLQSEIPRQLTQAQEPLKRINQLIDYQLQKAATEGNAQFAQSIDVILAAKRISASLQKVYFDKHIQLIEHYPESLLFKIDEDDFMELMGNLLDNAFKWATSRIIISIQQRQNKLHLNIQDDGPGFPQEHINKLLQRGTRADESIAGQGIGLSIVLNIIEQYQGSLKINTIHSLNSVQVIM